MIEALKKVGMLTLIFVGFSGRMRDERTL
ncbi:hypothetical protein LINPERPRIM_LOCUS5996 [Linum perenne]